MNEPIGHWSLRSEVVVLSERHLCQIGDGFEELQGLRPELADAALPGVEPLRAPCGDLIPPQAPEECAEARLTRRTAPHGKDARHHVGASVALLECVGQAGPLFRARDIDPQRPVGQCRTTRDADSER